MKTSTLSFKRKNKVYVAALSFLSPLNEDTFVLNPKEKQKLLGLAPLRKKTFISGRQCAKSSINKICGISNLSEIIITDGIFGFPIIIHPEINNLCVSIAHTNQSAIAITFPQAHPIGIDVEDICDERSQTIDSQLSKLEKNLREKTLLSEAVYNTVLWTAKESLGKILKTGLMVSQGVYEIKSVSQNKEGLYIIEYKNFFQYQCISYIYKNSIIGLCIPKNSELDLASLYKMFL